MKSIRKGGSRSRAELRLKKSCLTADGVDLQAAAPAEPRNPILRAACPEVTVSVYADILANTCRCDRHGHIKSPLHTRIGSPRGDCKRYKRSKYGWGKPLSLCDAKD
jgi:hypothetical protein